LSETRSVWQDTRTYFPLFLDLILSRDVEKVCVVGASDGKFVLPLARRGLRVVAVERDPLALDGGPVILPNQGAATMPGLRKRLAEEGLSERVQIIETDLLDLTVELPHVGAVWTSCSWHYSANHARPFADFITAMTGLCPGAGAVLGAEYMLPVQPHQLAIEHYPEQGEVRRFFRDWTIDWETYTPPFIEAPHVEQLSEHVHRIGLIIATRQ